MASLPSSGLKNGLFSSLRPPYESHKRQLLRGSLSNKKDVPIGTKDARFSASCALVKRALNCVKIDLLGLWNDQRFVNHKYVVPRGKSNRNIYMKAEKYE